MINWAYVAGFFEGEGCFNASHNSLAIYQKDPKPLEKIKDFVRSKGIKCSVVIRKTPRITNFLVINQESCLRVNGQVGVIAFLKHILPYMQTNKRLAVQDYLRFKTMFPPMTPRQCSLLGVEKARNSGRWNFQVRRGFHWKVGAQANTLEVARPDCTPSQTTD